MTDSAKRFRGEKVSTLTITGGGNKYHFSDEQTRAGKTII